MQCILSAGEGLVGRISARFAGTTVTITSFMFFSLGSNLEQTALQCCDLEESQSDAQPWKYIGKTFVQPRDGEQWPLACHLYFNLSLSLPLSASSEMGPEKPSQLLPCSWLTVVLQHIVPDLVSLELNFIWLPPCQQTHGLPGFCRSLWFSWLYLLRFPYGNRNYSTVYVLPATNCAVTWSLTQAQIAMWW